MLGLRSLDFEMSHSRMVRDPPAQGDIPQLHWSAWLHWVMH
jgi:hypothetical protein